MDTGKALAALPALLRGRLAKAIGGGAIALAMATVTYFEGYEPTPYVDPVGIPTVCVGHTGGVEMERVYSEAECDALLKGDLGVAFAAVDKYVRVPLGDATRAALASFVFNVGEGAFRKSTLLRRLNVGEGAPACAELKRWVCVKTVEGQGDIEGPCATPKRNRRSLPGLVKRRDVEHALCVEGFRQLADPGNDNVPLPMVRPERDAA